MEKVVEIGELEESSLETLYLKYFQFEECTKGEDQDFSEFLTEWTSRQKEALEAGFSYSDLMLAFKLLKDSCLDLDSHMVVFAKLRSTSSAPNTSPDSLTADTCLTAGSGLTTDCNLTASSNVTSSPNLTRASNSMVLTPNYFSHTRTCLLELYEGKTHVKAEAENLDCEDEVFQNQVESRNLSLNIEDKSESKGKNHEDDENCIPTKENSNLRNMKPKNEGDEGDQKTAVKEPLHDKDVDKKKPKVAAKRKNEIRREMDLTQVFHCPVEECNYVGKCEKYLRIHMKLSVHKSREKLPFKCVPCKGRRFETQELLDAHIAMHASHTCELCGKVFTKPGILSRHMKDSHHLYGKTFACEICGKLFYTSSNLNNHKNSHGERKQVCPWEGCGKAFLQPNILRRHMVVHTGQKNYECDQCGKCFGRQSGLSRHMDRHNGVKRAECDVCHKWFFDNGKLKVHMRVHTGERPYTCDICQRSFVQSKDLKQHLEKLHGHKQDGLLKSFVE